MMQTARWCAIALAIATLVTGAPTRADKAATAAAAPVAKTAPADGSEWYDVTISVSERPARGARLVFGLVNGDVKVDNHVVVRKLATSGGRIGAAKATGGSAYEVEGGFRIDDTTNNARDEFLISVNPDGTVNLEFQGGYNDALRVTSMVDGDQQATELYFDPGLTCPPYSAFDNQPFTELDVNLEPVTLSHLPITTGNTLTGDVTVTRGVWTFEVKYDLHVQ